MSIIKKQNLIPYLLQNLTKLNMNFLPHSKRLKKPFIIIIEEHGIKIIITIKATVAGGDTPNIVNTPKHHKVATSNKMPNIINIIEVTK